MKPIDPQTRMRAVAGRLFPQMVEGQGFDQGQRGAQKNARIAIATSSPGRRSSQKKAVNPPRLNTPARRTMGTRRRQRSVCQPQRLGPKGA